jgi:hypothetical protein
MSRKTVFCLTLMLIIFGVVGVILANGDFDIDWNVMAGGGGYVSSGAFVLDNTVGQATIGQVSEENASLCAGYWCLEAILHRLHLPIVLRFEE